jgi:hypothetical protein
LAPPPSPTYPFDFFVWRAEVAGAPILLLFCCWVAQLLNPGALADEDVRSKGDAIKEAIETQPSQLASITD